MLNSSTKTMTHEVLDNQTIQYKEILRPNVRQDANKGLIASAAAESLSIQRGGGGHYLGPSLLPPIVCVSALM